MIKEIFLIGAILVLGQVFSSLFKKVRIPDVLPLMLLGVLLGPLTHLVSHDSFGKTADIFTTIALILVLFRTGLALRFSSLREAWARGSALTIIFFALAGGAVFAICYFAFKINAGFSLILAAIAADNSFIIVLPLIQKLGLTKKTKAILLLETTVGGIMSVVLTLALIKMYAAGKIETGPVTVKVFYSFIAATAVGLVCGFFWTIALGKIRENVENSISFTFATLLLVYSLCSFINAEGAIGALAFGLVIGNIRVVKTFWLKNTNFSLESFNEKEKIFFNEIEFIFKTLFFVYMGICLKFDNTFFMLCGLILALAKIFVRVPVINFVLCKNTPVSDCATASILCPNGLVSAVLAATASQTLEGAALIEGIIFPLIFFSVIFTALLSFLIDKGYLNGLCHKIFKRHKCICAVNKENEPPENPNDFSSIFNE